MDLARIDQRLTEVQRGRKWILAFEAAAGVTGLAQDLRNWGATGVMVVSAVEGVGDLPAADRFFYTRTSGDTVMQGIRAYLDSVEHPSPELTAAVDEFDPSGDAQVITSGFGSYATLCNRPVYDFRPPGWVAFEDKIIIDELWDASGVTRADSAIVPVSEASDAALRLSESLGSVWVADNAEGWHGGGEYVRWVPTSDDAADAADWFATRSNRVRVMPFLDGIPCSIHGLVTANGVAVFLPVELLILRRLDRPGFVYARAANFWTPPDHIREEMRAAARAVGAELARRTGYRGAFGIDGVCTADGFRPTELNARFSVGHELQAHGSGIALGSMNRLCTAGDLEIDAGWIEDAVISKVEHERRGAVLFAVTDATGPAKTGVIFREDTAVAVDPDDDADAVMDLGRSVHGGLIIMRFDPEGTPIGPSVAPLAVRAARLANDLWGVGLPAVEAAPDLCREGSSG
jgi:hypothetical protein